MEPSLIIGALAGIFSPVKMFAIGFLVLGVLVLVHELGHFLMAKRCGVRVLTFSIGFGRTLYKKRFGGTDYQIALIPFGGFVHMAGEHPDDPHRRGEPDEFPSRPVWQRGLIALAGPVANYAFSLLLLWFVFMAGTREPVYMEQPVIGAIVDSSEAATAGFRMGDTIRAINDQPVSSWSQVEVYFGRLDSLYYFTIKRDSAFLTLPLSIRFPRGSSLPKYAHGGLIRGSEPRVGAVRRGSAAEKAGLKEGDLVAAIDDTAVFSWAQMSRIVSAFDTSKTALTLTVVRNGSALTVPARPTYSASENRSFLGIEAQWRTVRYGPAASVVKAWEQSVNDFVLTFVVIGKLITSEISPRQLSGPVGIVGLSGIVAQGGTISTLKFMAFIGVNLAILNLLPLVITDGGLLLFLLIEAIRRKPLSRQVQAAINRGGIAFFIALFLFVTFNDLVRLPEFFRLLR